MLGEATTAPDAAPEALHPSEPILQSSFVKEVGPWVAIQESRSRFSRWARLVPGRANAFWMAKRPTKRAGPIPNMMKEMENGLWQRRSGIGEDEGSEWRAPSWGLYRGFESWTRLFRDKCQWRQDGPKMRPGKAPG